MGAAWERESEGVTGAAQFPQTVWFRGGALRRPPCPRRAGRPLHTSGRINRSSEREARLEVGALAWTKGGALPAAPGLLYRLRTKKS